MHLSAGFKHDRLGGPVVAVAGPLIKLFQGFLEFLGRLDTADCLRHLGEQRQAAHSQRHARGEQPLPSLMGVPPRGQ